MDFPELKSVKEGTFIHDYISQMYRYETSTSYDYISALWILGVILGRSAYVDRPGLPVYLNLYAILCAESGVTRKSTAVKFARDIVKRFFTEHPDLHTLVIESKMTPEMLEWTLQRQSNDFNHAYAAIVISELVTFLGREKYAMHMPGLLTDLYDSPSLRAGGGTIGRGTTRIRNVFVSFFSASTPSWLLRAINPDVVEGGFTSRCLFIHDESPKRPIAWPSQRGASPEFGYRRLEALHKEFTSAAVLDDGTSTLSFTLESRGLDTFRAWYDTRPLHRDPFQASFESREDDHALRIAALLSANNATTVITHEAITDALAVVKWAKAGASAIFAYTTDNPLVTGIDRIRMALVEAGSTGLRQSQITHKASGLMKAAEVTIALEIMHELNMVQRFEIPIRRGRPATLWRATKFINGPDAIRMVIDHWELTNK